MSLLSAYNLLEEFSKHNEVEILSYKVNFLKNVTVLEIDPVQNNFSQNAVLENKFLSKHLCTCNSFIQITNKQSIQTEIATMGVPFAPELNEIDFQNQDQVYKIITKNLKDSFTIQDVQHKSYTISISFCDQLDSFCISFGTKTIICYDEKDIDLFQEPMHEQPRKAAFQFFNLFNRMPKKMKLNFIQDLINRSLVGCYNHKMQIEWFAIVEHYSEQRMVDPKTVKNFLNHYKLETTQTNIIQSSQIQLQKQFSQIFNLLIEQYHNYYQGKTLYFWKENAFLGCCFLSFRQYSILDKLRIILQNKEKKLNKQEPYQYLSEFNLNDQDLEFYRKYTDMMLQVPDLIQSKKQYAKLSIQAFNSIRENLDYLSKQENNLLPLSYCIQQIIIVVIPIGISGMGYEKLCSLIQKTGQRVQIIKIPDQVNEKNQLYFYEKVCNPKELELINKQFKSLGLNIKTIALLPECNYYHHKEKQCNFPFSFNFIMYCLISVLDDKQKVQEVINQLKEFNNQKLDNFQTDYKIYCRFMPEQKERNDLYSELVEQDFLAALASQNDQLIESLSQYKQTQINFSENNLKQESKRVIAAIEEKSQIILRKSVKFQIENDQHLKYGLFIEKPDWEAINNFVYSCIESIVQEYPDDRGINRMYIDYEKQIRAQNAVFMKINQPYMQVRQLQGKPIDAQVSIAVIIVDGIIMLQPKDLGQDLQDIPIYSHNIDVLKSNKVSDQVKIEIRKMQKQNVEDRTVKKKQINFNNKNWDAYIVKFKPFNIKLVERQIN